MINLLLQNRYTKNSPTHHLSLENMTIKQQKKIKSSIIDTNNCLNENFLFIEQATKINKATKLIFINLTRSFRTLYWISIPLLSSLMKVLRIMLLHLYYISIHILMVLRKLFTMLLTLLQLRLNYLPSDMGLIKLFKFQRIPIL